MRAASRTADGRTPFAVLVRVLASVSSFAALACAQAPASDDVATRREAVVYGTDGRHEIRDEPDTRLVQIARERAVAIVPRQAVSEDEGRVSIAASSARETFGLCEGERFGEQPSGAFCTGFLVEPDLVLTAGHCLLAFSCRSSMVVRGYEMASEAEPAAIGSAGVARCLEVEADTLGEEAGGVGIDVAWIRLDRELAFATTAEGVAMGSSELSAGQEAILIGNGLGIPTKIDRGTVAESGSADGESFRAAVDNFVGGSGAPLFDLNGRLLGIATGGQADFLETGAGCRITRRLEPSHGDEKIIRIERAMEKLDDVLPTAEPGAIPESSGSCAVASSRAYGPATWAFAITLAIAARARRIRRWRTICAEVKSEQKVLRVVT
jgi:hypothetical protein